MAAVESVSRVKAPEAARMLCPIHRNNYNDQVVRSSVHRVAVAAFFLVAAGRAKIRTGSEAGRV